MAKLTGDQIADAGLAGWANLAGGLQTRIQTLDFGTGLTIVNAIAAAAEQRDHHPDLDLRYAHVDVRLSSHDVGGITSRDVDLVRTITSIAADAGVELDSTTVSRLEFGLDSPAHPSILPFWAAALGLEPSSQPDVDHELSEPTDALPTLWFQPSGSEEPRQRWHPDLWIEPAQVQPRIDAAVAAGGTLVSDDEAPSFWVLADPEGNLVCLCTWQNRG